MADHEPFRVSGRLVSELRVVDLKKELDLRGLSKSGTKTELIKRLKSQLVLENLQSQPVEEGKVPNIDLQQDAVAGQSDFVKQYLAQQQMALTQKTDAWRQLEDEKRRESEGSATEPEIEVSKVTPAREKEMPKLADVEIESNNTLPQEAVSSKDIPEPVSVDPSSKDKNDKAKDDTATKTLTKDDTATDTLAKDDSMTDSLAKNEKTETVAKDVTLEDTLVKDIKEADTLSKVDTVTDTQAGGDEAVVSKSPEDTSPSKRAVKIQEEAVTKNSPRSSRRTKLKRTFRSEPPDTVAEDAMKTDNTEDKGNEEVNNDVDMTPSMDAVDVFNRSTNILPAEDSKSEQTAGSKEEEPKKQCEDDDKPQIAVETDVGELVSALEKKAVAEDDSLSQAQVDAGTEPSPAIEPMDVDKSEKEKPSDTVSTKPEKEGQRSRSSSAESRSRSRSPQKRASSRSSSSDSSRSSRSPSPSEQKQKKLYPLPRSISRSPPKSRSFTRSPPKFTSESRSPSPKSVTHSETPRKTRSRSGSRSSSSSSSKSRSMSKSGSSSSSDSEEESATKMKASVQKAPVVKRRRLSEEVSGQNTSKNEESYFTAPEDVSMTVDKVSGEHEQADENKENDEVSMDTDMKEVKPETPSVETDNQPEITEIPSEEKPRAQRKRRWGSTRTAAPTRRAMNISTDSLKGLIPEIKASPPPAPEMVLDLGTDGGQVSEPEEDGARKELGIRRTVIQVVRDNATSVEEEAVVKEESVTDTEPAPTAKSHSPVKVEAESETTSPAGGKITRPPIISIGAEEPVAARRTPSPSRYPVSKIVHVRHLVRPFTLGQLKELLNRTGKMIEAEFWIDKIKSHCFATYETEDEAMKTRLALHGTKWPPSNPKVLHVDFSTTHQLSVHRGDDVPPPEVEKPKVKAELPKHDREREKDKDRERTRERRRSDKTSKDIKSPEVKKPPPMREWDRGKIQQKSKSPSPVRGRPRSRDRTRPDDKHRTDRSRDKKDKKEKKPTSTEEAPAKLLDNLFRKTKATPWIYWLPLTEEQIAVKEKQKSQRLEEQAKRMKEREKMEEEERKQREIRRKERQKEIEEREKSRGNQSTEGRARRSESGTTRRR